METRFFCIWFLFFARFIHSFAWFYGWHSLVYAFSMLSDKRNGFVQIRTDRLQMHCPCFCCVNCAYVCVAFPLYTRLIGFGRERENFMLLFNRKQEISTIYTWLHNSRMLFDKTTVFACHTAVKRLIEKPVLNWHVIVNHVMKHTA